MKKLATKIIAGILHYHVYCCSCKQRIWSCDGKKPEIICSTCFEGKTGFQHGTNGGVRVIKDTRGL